MLSSSSFAYVADNIGVETVKIFQILGPKGITRSASIGDMVYCSVKTINRLLFNRLKERQKKRFKRGTIHRAIVIHTKKKVYRKDYT
jgi:ribosomal protein L14